MMVKTAANSNYPTTDILPYLIFYHYISRCIDTIIIPK